MKLLSPTTRSDYSTAHGKTNPGFLFRLVNIRHRCFTPRHRPYLGLSFRSFSQADRDVGGAVVMVAQTLPRVGMMISRKSQTCGFH